MANFRNYREERDDRRGLFFAAAAGVGLAFAVPEFRQAAAGAALKFVQGVGNRFVKNPGKLQIEHMGEEMARLLNRALPRAAHESITHQRATAGLASRFVESGLAEEIAEAEARRFTQNSRFRQFLMNKRDDVSLLWAEDDLAQAFEARTARITSERNAELTMGNVQAEIIERRRQRLLQEERSRLETWFNQLRDETPTTPEIKTTASYDMARRNLLSMMNTEAERLGQWENTFAGKVGAAFGVRPVTAKDLFDGAAIGTNTDNLGNQLKYLREILGDERVNNIPLGQIVQIGDEIYDLSAASQALHSGLNWLKENFQIPLAPGAMGISPFQLFPWLQGNLRSQFTHIASDSRDPLLRAAVNAEGELVGKDVFKVGQQWAAIDFLKTEEDEIFHLLDMAGDAWTGRYGYRARRNKAVNAARAAKENGEGTLWEAFGGGSQQYGNSVWDKLRSVLGKYSPDSNWGPSVIDRVMTADQANLQVSDIKRVIGFLKSGGQSPELRAALQQEVNRNPQILANLLGEEAPDIIAGLGTEDGVRRFLGSVQTSEGIFSRELKELLGQYQSSPESFWRRYKPSPDHSVFGYNILGRPADENVYGIVRNAIYDELEERISRSIGTAGEAGENRFLEWLGEQDLGLSRTQSEAYAHAKVMERRLQTKEYDNPYHYAAQYIRKDETGVENLVQRQQVLRNYAADRTNPWDSFVEDEEGILNTNTVFSPYGVMATFNRAMAAGKGWGGSFQEAYGVAVKSTKGFFNGNQADVTDTTLALEYFPRRLNELLADLGMGLNAADLETGWSTLKNLFLKRVGPAVAAVEGYRYLDYKADALGIERPSDLYANLRARGGRWRSRKMGESFFGVDRDLLPGLEKFIPTRSEEEEIQHQEDGWEGVRRGRYWFLGSRGEFWGDKLSYYAPSAVAAARSGWQESGNVDLSGRDYWAHSTLPLPENFFLGPLGGALSDPYWWERKHAAGDNADRPYLVTGERFDPHTAHGVLGNFLFGWTKPRVVLHREYVPMNLGGDASKADLRRINETIKRGGSPLPLESVIGAGYNSGWSDAGMGTPGAVGGGSGADGGLGEITPAGQIALKQLPTGGGSGGGGGSSATSYGSLIPTTGHGLASGEKKGLKLSQNELRRINEMTKAGMGGLTPLKSNTALRLAQQRGPFDTADGDLIDYENGLITGSRNLFDLAGLYGFMVEQAARPEQEGLTIQGANLAYGFNRRFYNNELGGLGGGFSEFGRRFIPRSQRYKDYNPVRSAAAASWLPGSEYFLDLQHGDIFSKIPKGELRLPGEAYESVHPNIKLMQTRASSLGKTEEELMRSMLFLEEPLSNYGVEVTEQGTAIHRRLQRHWKRMGILLAAEDRIYNPELGISGHFDAILNVNHEAVVGEIKTVNQKRYDEALRVGILPEHRTQLNFYLHEMKLNKGLVFYVNRDNPEQIRLAEMGYDPGLWNQTLAKVQRARSRVLGLVDRGLVSRGDLYDPVTRFEILSDVAPYSDNYAQMRQYLTNKNQEGELSEEENARFQAAKKRVAASKKRVTLYPYRFRNVDLTTKNVIVDEILDATTFTVLGQYEPIRLAGVEKPSRARIEAEFGAIPEGVDPGVYLFQKLGIYPGGRLNIQVSRDPMRQFSKDGMHTQRAVAYAGGRNVNRYLLQTGIADEAEGDWSAPGVKSRFSEHEMMIGRLWEAFSHLDTPLHTKFLKVRSPLEELKRGIVYGKSTGGWQDAFGDYVVPTVESYVSKDPIIGGLAMGTFASYFFSRTPMKAKAFQWGALVGATASAARLVNDMTGQPWKPMRTRKREELEEYWDILKYVKYRALAGAEEKLARQKEGVNVDRLVRETYQEGEKRKRIKRSLERKRRALLRKGRVHHREEIDQLTEQINGLSEPKGMLRLGKHTSRALMYRQMFRSTLHGADPNITPFQDIMRAFPKYKRELLDGFINSSSEAERREIYRLLPRQEQRVLGKYLGIDKSKIPKRPELTDYFKDHVLPGPNWEGWLPSVDLEDLRIQALKGEGLDPMESAIFPNQIEEAHERTERIPIPTLKGDTHAIQATLNQILSGHGVRNALVRVELTPHNGEDHDVHVNMNINHRREQALASSLGLLNSAR